MANSFTITTRMKTDAEGHTEAVFNVTNTTTNALRGTAKAKALDDTKDEWLSIAGDDVRDFAAGATQEFTVKFDAVPPTPPADDDRTGKYSFRLDFATAMNPSEDFAEGPVVHVDIAPADLTVAIDQGVSALAADPFQPNTWYATTGTQLLRSIDNGEGWEPIYDFPEDEKTVNIRVNNSKPGQLGVITNKSDAGSRLYVFDDCGRMSRTDGADNKLLAETAFTINDLAWTSLLDEPVLILASDYGLFDLSLQPGAVPVQIMVDDAKPTLGFVALAATAGVESTPYVAAASRSASGVSVYLSAKGGASETYEPLGLRDEHVFVLEVQQDGLRTYLWAGLAVMSGSEAGKGAVRWELQQGSAGAHTFISKGWEGSSCHGLAFGDSFAFAAAHDEGVLWLDTNKGEQATWRLPLRESGLQLREDDVRAFKPIRALAAAAQPVTDSTAESRQNIVMAGGGSEGFAGIYRSRDNGATYELCSDKTSAASKGKAMTA